MPWTNTLTKEQIDNKPTEVVIDGQTITNPTDQQLVLAGWYHLVPFDMGGGQIINPQWQ
jgi:hypothetical protein